MKSVMSRPVLPLLVLIFVVVPAIPAIAESTAFDPGFVFDVIDPGFCEMPPVEYSDADILSMLSVAPAPVSGELTGPVRGQVRGVGYFRAEGGIVATFSTFVIVSDSELMVLCMAIMPVGATDLENGEAVLAGPVPEAAEGQTYLAVVQLGRRDGERVVPIGNLERGTGSIRLSMPNAETLEGSLRLTGRIEGLSAATGNDFLLSLAFEDMLLNPLRMLRLSEN